MSLDVEVCAPAVDPIGLAAEQSSNTIIRAADVDDIGSEFDGVEAIGVVR